MDVETIVLPCEKDDTDTLFAVKEALKRGFEDFILIGVVGARLDHTLGNVSILLHLDSLGNKGKIIDDYSEMEIVSKEPAYIDDSYSKSPPIVDKWATLMRLKLKVSVPYFFNLGAPKNPDISTSALYLRL